MLIKFGLERSPVRGWIGYSLLCNKLPPNYRLTTIQYNTMTCLEVYTDQEYGSGLSKPYPNFSGKLQASDVVAEKHEGS